MGKVIVDTSVMKNVLDEKPQALLPDLGRIEQLLHWILLIQVVVLVEENR